MDNAPIQKDTTAWIFQVWVSFLASMAAMIVGILHLPVDGWVRGYMAMGTLFTVGSAFTLAKTIRDNYEAGKLISRLSEAKTEKLLRDYELTEAR
jgi:hypothetical protein